MDWTKEITLSEKQNIFIFDLGGGTFDVSLLTIKDKVFNLLKMKKDKVFQVKAIAGRKHSPRRRGL
jgi:molecular chaperone DnaK (HSP70)